MTEISHTLASLSVIIISCWGLLEFIFGMWKGNYPQATFGLCLGIFAVTVK